MEEPTAVSTTRLPGFKLTPYVYLREILFNIQKWVAVRDTQGALLFVCAPEVAERHIRDGNALSAEGRGKKLKVITWTAPLPESVEPIEAERPEYSNRFACWSWCSTSGDDDTPPGVRTLKYKEGEVRDRVAGRDLCVEWPRIAVLRK